MRLLILVVEFLGLSHQAYGALMLNAAQTITQVVTVQPVVVSDTGGGNTATFFGDASQQATIFSLIDQIWAQAGIDVSWLAPNFWSNTSANIGVATTAVARPESDLFFIRATGDFAGAGSANPLVIDMYFVRAAAGFAVLPANFAAGLAVLGGNGITAYIGSALLSSTGGQEAIAGVIAHEIGHNLGLPHIVSAINLMHDGSSVSLGEQLNAAQITAALNSNFSVPLGVPEPVTFVLVSLALPLIFWRRRAI